MQYASVEQRMAKAYIDLFPSFVPAENDLSIEEQRAFYDLILGLYQLAYEEPELFVKTLHEDDAYPTRYKKPYGKPKLIEYMRKFRKEVDALLEAMFNMGKGAEDIRLTKRQRTVLERLNAAPPSPVFSSWAWMATRPGADLISFSHCFFDAERAYASELYRRLLGDERAFDRLESWLLGQGYQRHCISNAIASDCDVILTYANPSWSDQPPKGGFEYGIVHTGVSMQYDFYTAQPAVIGLCIPGGMKKFLLAFDDMSDTVQEFVIERTKMCDDCGYCTQTDKTGKRAKAYCLVQRGGKEYPLCTYFPGYSYSWTELTESLVDQMIAFLSFMDSRQEHV